MWITRKGETSMTRRFLVIALGLASVFTVQQASAKPMPKQTSAAHKHKHNNKHKTKKAMGVDTVPELAKVKAV
jgi:hypothetical protein